MSLPSTRPTTLVQGQDFYVPAFEIKIGDRSLKGEPFRDILQVIYKDSLTEYDSVEIKINNWDSEKRTFKYSDETLFDPGQRVELKMGYLGKANLRLMLTGHIKTLKPTFPAAGQPTLSIGGLNLLERLKSKQVTEVYKDKTDHDIARKIQSRLPLEIELVPNAIGARQKYPYIIQDNQYDILFLMERARRIGYDLFIVEPAEDAKSSKPRLYFGPSNKVKRTNYELEYGRTLTEFQPTLNITKQVKKVTVQGWNAVKKKRIKVTVGRDELDIKGLGCAPRESSLLKHIEKDEETISNIPVRDEAEARTLAKETLEKIVKNMVTASGSVIGLPELRTGSVLYIRGVGECFSGHYFVTATTHSISDSGYTTQFDCRLEEPR